MTNNIKEVVDQLIQEDANSRVDKLLGKAKDRKFHGIKDGDDKPFMFDEMEDFKKGKNSSFAKELQKIFPESEGYVVGTGVSMLGGPSVPSFHLTLYNTKDSANNISRNSAAYMDFWVHMKEGVDVWKWELSTWSYFELKDFGVKKFRAIRSTKSFDDANTKFIKWMKSQKPAIHKAVEKGRERM